MAQVWVAPFLASLPPWWRLLQCFRRYRDSDETVHLYNAAKYTSSIMAAIVTGLRRMYRKSILYKGFSLFILIHFNYSVQCHDSVLGFDMCIKFMLYKHLGY